MKILSVLFAIVVGVILPVGVGIWLSAKKKGYIKPVLLGAATFLVFQIVTRIPLLQAVLPGMLWYTIFSATQPFLHALFLGATAALFEEGGRWLVMTVFMKNRNRLTDGVAFGVGHGGIEAIYILGIAAVWLLFDRTQSYEPVNLLWGSLERVSTMVVHIAWSVMVFKSVALKKPVWLLLAFLLHTAIDTTVVLLPRAGASSLLIEAVILVFALLMLTYIIIEYKKNKGGEFQ